MGDPKNIWAYIKNYKFNSLFFRNFMLITLLLAIPFAILSFFYYSKVSRSASAETAKENQTTAENSKNVLDTMLGECDMLGIYISNNDNVQMFMLNDWFNDGESIIGDFSQFVKTIPMIYQYIDSVYIYSESNNEVFIGERKTPLDSLKDNNWLDVYRSTQKRQGVVIPRIKNENFPQLISIIKPVYVDNVKKGAVILNVNSSKLYKAAMPEAYKGEQESFIIDDAGLVLMSRDPKFFGKYYSDIDTIKHISIDKHPQTTVNETNGVKTIVSTVPSKNFEFEYVNTMPMTSYQSKVNIIRSQIILIFLILLLLSLILAYIIALKSYAPVRKIISFIDDTNNSESTDTENDNELSYIINSIKKHIVGKEQLEMKMKERLELLKQSQYYMLQAQINPHFLYNTLETINWMAYDLVNDENDVSRAVVNLASLFRYNVSDGEFLIPIEVEIKRTKDYISILNLRYGGLFDVIWDIDESISNYAIIKICLQPVIENAVYHGLKPKESNGLIKISAHSYGDYIVFTVYDNGVGIEEEALTQMNAQLRSETYRHSGHIGIFNVNQRIKIIFGEEYGLYVESEKGKGTSVIIEFPKTALPENII